MIAKSSVYKAVVLTVLAHLVQHPSWGNMNFSRTTTGMTKWFWVTMEGYLSYILPKFEDLVPTKKGLSIFVVAVRHSNTKWPLFFVNSYN